jgi:hypothetical protein
MYVCMYVMYVCVYIDMCLCVFSCIWLRPFFRNMFFIYYFSAVNKWIIIALSFAGTAVASVITYVNPVVKWEQLRLGECAIKSEV